MPIAATAAGQPATAKKTAVGKTPQAVKSTKTGKAAKAGRPGRRAAAAADQVGPAELLEADSVGLRGQASFYGHGFSGRKTATGEIFDVRQFTAASNRYPLGTLVAVHRLDNDRCAIVKVNDRMHGKHRRRVIDVSRGAAQYLDMIRAGVVLVRVAPLKGNLRNDSSCLASFETDAAQPAATSTAAWPDAAFPPQLDAMH